MRLFTATRVIACGLLTVTPMIGAAQFGGLLDKAKKAVQTKQPARADDMSGPARRQDYVVRFSTKPFDPAHPDATPTVNRFTGSDPIYGLIVFSEPLKSERVLGDAYSDRLGTLNVRASVNEDPNFPANGPTVSLKVSPQQANGNAFAFTIIPAVLPSATDYETLQHILLKPFVESVLELHKNRNERTFDVRVTAGEVNREMQGAKNIRTGSHFTLDLTGGLGRYKEIVSKYQLSIN